MKKENRESKNKKMKSSIKILIASILVLVIASLFFNLQGIMLIKPIGHITDTNPVFKWGSINGYSYYNLLIDDNPGFTSPLIIETKEKEYRANNLSAGDYYWKVIGYNKNRTESSVYSFSIDSIVAVATTDSQIKNVGNVKLLLEFFSGNLLTGFATLDINKASNLSKNITEVIASQK